jgi:hypothetical protein
VSGRSPLRPPRGYVRRLSSDPVLATATRAKPAVTSLQKLVHECHCLLGHLLLWGMPAAFENLKVSVGQFVRQLAAQCQRNHFIFGTPDHQCGLPMIPYISRMVLVVIASFTTAVLLTVTAIWAIRQSGSSSSAVEMGIFWVRRSGRSLGIRRRNPPTTTPLSCPWQRPEQQTRHPPRVRSIAFTFRGATAQYP